MNLLAHAYLGRDLPLESNAFNVLWDFVSRDYLQDTREVVLLGRQRHVTIDKMADIQPWFLRSRKLCSQERRKASPVLVDIFADYLLIQQWDLIEEPGSDDHINQFLNDLCEGAAMEGGKLLGMAETIRDQGWFDDYRTLGGVGRVLDRVSRRSSPRLAAMLTGAEEDLRIREEEFQDGFPEFMKNLDQQLRPQ